jgi:hypothetical protein
MGLLQYSTTAERLQTDAIIGSQGGLPNCSAGSFACSQVGGGEWSRAILAHGNRTGASLRKGVVHICAAEFEPPGADLSAHSSASMAATSNR